MTNGALIGIHTVASVLDGHVLAVWVVLTEEDGGAFDHASVDPAVSGAMSFEFGHCVVKVHVRGKGSTRERGERVSCVEVDAENIARVRAFRDTD